MRMMEDVYKLCTAQPVDHSESLYRALVNFFADHVLRTLRSLRALTSDEEHLRCYLENWRAFSTGVLYVNALCFYLNNNWIKKQRSKLRASDRKRLNTVPTADYFIDHLPVEEEEQDESAGGRRGRRSRGAAPDSLANNGGLHESRDALVKSAPMEVNALGFLCWLELLFSGEQERLVRTTLRLVARHRSGEQVDIRPVATLARCCMQLGATTCGASGDAARSVYARFFERRFVAASRDFYAHESTTWLADSGVIGYLNKAHARLSEEHLLAKRALDSSSMRALSLAFDEEYIGRHAQRLLDECPRLFFNETQQRQRGQLTHLNQIFLLISRLRDRDNLKRMVGLFHEFCRRYVEGEVGASATAMPGAETQESVVGGPLSPQQIRAFVNPLLNSYTHLEELLQGAFASHSEFVAARDKVFQELLASRRNTAQMLARYSNLLLRSGGVGVDAGDVEAALQQLLSLFNYLRDKDVFMKFYSIALSKRLIDGTSVSDDAERFMLASMKQLCGLNYVSKQLRMFSDISTSADLNEEYQKWNGKQVVEENEGERDRPGDRLRTVPASFLILTSSAWPFSASSLLWDGLRLPSLLEQSRLRFTQFYKGAHEGRKLHWLHGSRCRCEVRTGSQWPRRYELLVNDVQLSLLLLFNDQSLVSRQLIQQAVGVSDTAIDQTLASFLDAKMIIASRNNSSGSTEETSATSVAFALSPSFHSKRIRVNLTARIQRTVQPAETRATMEAIQKDRRLILQATIVRVAKARRQLTQTALMAEVLDQVSKRFQPKPSLINNEIEILIEGEYLERENEHIIKYVA